MVLYVLFRYRPESWRRVNESKNVDMSVSGQPWGTFPASQCSLRDKERHLSPRPLPCLSCRGPGFHGGGGGSNDAVGGTSERWNAIPFLFTFCLFFFFPGTQLHDDSFYNLCSLHHYLMWQLAVGLLSRLAAYEIVLRTSPSL